MHQRIASTAAAAAAASQPPQLSTPIQCRAARRPTQLSAGDLPSWSPQYCEVVNPLALAYVGDAVWSLHLRASQLLPPKHPQLYQQAVRPHVTAEAQAALLSALTASGRLTPAELELVDWAAAAAPATLRPRFASNPGGTAAYGAATALEALLGHWHLTDPQRLQQQVAWLLEAATEAAPRQEEQ